MGKTVTHANEFRDPIQISAGPDRHLVVLACDDSSIYEFQKLDDAPVWNLRARGSRDEPRAQWTDRKAPLPSDVKDTLDSMAGEKGWRK